MVQNNLNCYYYYYYYYYLLLFIIISTLFELGKIYIALQKIYSLIYTN